MKTKRCLGSAFARPTLVLWLACAGALHCVQLEEDGGVTKQWGQAERVDPIGGTAADVALDATGNAVLAWVGAQGATVWASRSKRGDEPAWSPPEQLNSLRVTVPGGLAVAIDATGNAVVVWGQHFTHDNVYAIRSTPSGSWGGVGEPLDDDNGDSRSPSDSGPQVSMNADGATVVVWVQGDSPQADVWAARATPGGPWSSAERLETSTATKASWPEVAVDDDGNAIAVWAMAVGVTSNIWSNRYTAGVGWESNARRIETNNAGDSKTPQVGVDAQGNAIAVWTRSNGLKSDIWSSRYSSSTAAWDDVPRRIDSEDEGDAVEPDVAVFPNGTAIAVWSQFDGSIQDVWSSRYAGASWGAAQRIEDNDAGSAVASRVAVAPNGTAVAVWKQLESGVWASVYTPNGSWGSAGAISTGDRDAGNPRIAMDPNGNAVAVWTLSVGTNKGVWANWLE